jgi:hypothetical protein
MSKPLQTVDSFSFWVEATACLFSCSFCAAFCLSAIDKLLALAVDEKDDPNKELKASGPEIGGVEAEGVRDLEVGLEDEGEAKNEKASWLWLGRCRPP